MSNSGRRSDDLLNAPVEKAIFNMTGYRPGEGYNRTINIEYENKTPQDIFVIAQFNRISAGRGGVSYRAVKYGESSPNLIITKAAENVNDQIEFMVSVPPGGIYEFSCAAAQYDVYLWNETRIIVDYPPIIKTQPVDITVPLGQEYTLSCTLEDNGGVISWEWWEVDSVGNDVGILEGLTGQGSTPSVTVLTLTEDVRHYELRASNTARRNISSSVVGESDVVVSKRISVNVTPLQDAVGVAGSPITITAGHVRFGSRDQYGYGSQYPRLGSYTPTTIDGITMSEMSTKMDSSGSTPETLSIRPNPTYRGDKEFTFIHDNKILLRTTDSNRLQTLTLANVSSKYTQFARTLKNAYSNSTPLKVKISFRDI